MATKSPPLQPHLRAVPPAAGTATSVFGGRPSGRERLLGFFAVLGICALVLGVPAVLVTLFGWPLPTRLPDRDMLTAPVTTDTLLGAIAVLTWIGYLHFLWCLIVEARAALSGRGLPGRVPLGGSSQDLARRLVTTALLLVTVTPGLAAASAVFDPPAPPPAVVADAGTAARERAPRPADPAVLAGAPAPDAVPAAPAALPYGGEFAPGTRLYVVQPPHGRHHDNLWDIAERHLGEGRRYREIFELNQHREQPDGDRLELARLIQPGWLLVMPPDAIGVDVVPEPAPPPIPAPAPADISVTADRGNDAVVDPAADADASQSPDGRAVAPELVGAGLLASGLLVALAARRQAQRRRRGAGQLLPVPDPDAAAVEVTLRLAADPAGSAFLDAALRTLAAACVAAGRAFPSVYAVRLGPDRAELLLALPDDNVPAPFAALADGRRWTVDRSADLGELPTGVRPPLPGLVGLGTDPKPADPTQPQTQLLVDLEEAGGLVGVDGDADIVREILAAAAVELATNGWSDSLRLTLVGFGDGLRDLAPDRVLTVERLDDVLPELERRVAETAVLLDQNGIGSVLTGRLRGLAGELINPDYLILAQPPDASAQDRLAALVRDGHRVGLAVLSAGPVAGARWRLAVASEDELSIDVLGLTVEPQRLGSAAYDAVVELARTAASPPLPPPSGAGAAAARDRLALVNPGSAFDPDSGGAAALQPRPPAPVEIRVLGPLQVTGDALDEVRRTPVAEELAALLALHRHGLRPEEVGRALFPHGARPGAVAAEIARVQEWLGTEPGTHAALLRTDEGGRVGLAAAVRVDWDVFRADVAAATTTDELEAALRLVRGPLLAGHPVGRYAWLAQSPVEYDVPAHVADVADRVARQRLAEGDAARAARIARSALVLDRDNAALWRALLDAELRRDSAAARDVAAAARRRLGRIPEPELAELVHRASTA